MKKIYAVFSIVVLILIVTAMIWRHTIVKDTVGQRQRVISPNGNTEMNDAKFEETDQDNQSSKVNYAIPYQEEDRKKAGETSITDDEAIAIARKAIGNLPYDEQAEVIIERGPVEIRIVFPAIGYKEKGPFVRGLDYAAEVYVDAKTGKVLRAFSG